MSRRDHSGHDAALHHAGAQPALYGRDPRQETGCPDRTEKGARDRRQEPGFAPPLVEAAGLAVPVRCRSRARRCGVYARRDRPLVIRYSLHAEEAMAERGIDRAWIEAAIDTRGQGRRAPTVRSRNLAAVCRGLFTAPRAPTSW